MSENQQNELNKLERELSNARIELKHAQCFMMATTDLRETIDALEHKKSRILAKEHRKTQQALA